ncbi:hypothetical protein GCM10009560_14440 [Nonomuraea longicatena]|uniref:DUF6879 domain-containing protein n=1 Tax=Nonomuraea longicatena TaxID=83682 RepID=A0ABN1NW08_9ACTN
MRAAGRRPAPQRVNPFARLAASPSHRLAKAEYDREVEHALMTGRAPIWKLERAQSFLEPDVASWRAMRAGDWRLALSLIDDMRDGLAELYERIPPVHRVRVVERPLTPYVCWEMHVLCAREAAGEHVRVVPADRVRHLDPLPEVLILSARRLYVIGYDECGAHLGGCRHTDPTLVRACERAVSELFACGEPLGEWFAREL